MDTELALAEAADANLGTVVPATAAKHPTNLAVHKGACRLLGLLAASHHSHVAAAAAKGARVMSQTLDEFLDDADAVSVACSSLLAMTKSRSVETVGAVALLLNEDPVLPKVVAAVKVHLRYSLVVVRCEARCVRGSGPFLSCAAASPRPP